MHFGTKSYLKSNRYYTAKHTLNVLPRHMLSEITVDESHMRPSTMMTMTYNGLPR